MTTLAELRLANLREQKKSAEPAAAEPAAEIAPVPEPAAVPEPDAPPRPVSPAAGTYTDLPVRGDDLVLSQYLTDTSPDADAEADAAEAERTAAFFERVHAALTTKTHHPSGAKVTVDMSTALFHRTKRYCLDHGNVTLRQLFLDLMTEFLSEEGY